MTNILQAILNISKSDVKREIRDYYKNSIRIQQVGDALEFYVKDAFCNSFEINNIAKKEENYRNNFSYLGNSNNPPDIIIKGGDAIEVKKIEGKSSTISLNSSFPKDKLYSEDEMITNACRECEDWDIKDLIYAIGTVNDGKLKSIWFVYGDCYAADREVYTRVKNCISSGVERIDNVEFSPTKELGRVNKVDPLGITYLRVRGMWGIEHPVKLFDDIEDVEDNLLNCIISEEKYLSFPKDDILSLEKSKSINVKNVDISDPNNPAKTLKAKYIYIEESI